MNLQSASSISASQVVQKVQMPSKNTIILQQGQGGTLQVFNTIWKEQEFLSHAIFLWYQCGWLYKGQKLSYCNLEKELGMWSMWRIFVCDVCDESFETKMELESFSKQLWTKKALIHFIISRSNEIMCM